MKFTLSWLKDYLETNASLDHICETLTNIGLELESCEDPAAQYAPFTVAYVSDAQPHPDADKLQVLTVDTAAAKGLQVVCGAPNARKGMKGIFAPEGTYIPGLDVTLKKAKIRGVESNGMMVSEKEMCLSDEHKGIIEVDSKYEIGTPMAEIFGLNDPIIEIGLTPNRADCAGIYGIARDLAAAGLGTLKTLPVKPQTKEIAPSIKISINDTEGCPLFLGREIKNIKNGPSPEWLQKRLKAVGLRPISALVDITNYINQSFARPLHVYDAAKLKGNITVGTSKGGEQLEALNDKTYTLTEGAITINDDSGVIGLAGIVGGTSTGCEADATSIVLECAYFTPQRIARSGRDLGIISDARYRFERGIDPEFTYDGMELAAQMILDLCSTADTQISTVIKAGNTPDWKRSYDYSPDLMKTLIGLDVPVSEQKDILTKLGFDIKGDNPMTITPPSWRGDILGAADITEEIVRIKGLDAIPSISVKPESAVPHSAETPLLTRMRQARIALAARGMNECVTWSFLSDKAAQNFGLNDNAKRKSLTVVNAISSEIDVMRSSILPNLIDAAARNAAMGNINTALCEIGPVFNGVKPEDQLTIAAGIRAGNTGDRHWSGKDANRPVDAFDAKADALAALEAVGAPAANAPISRDAPEYFHPGRSGAIRLGKNVLAYFGEIHPAILADMDIKTPLVGFEIILDNIPAARKKGTGKPYLTLGTLQPLTRDFAFLVKENVEADTIIKAALSADKKLITNASIFDVYQGKGVEDGHKSIALSVTIQPREATLTDTEIDILMKAVIDAVTSKTGGSLRS
jgi:phenylalanyl-tRNA synthetase beta chain